MNINGEGFPCKMKEPLPLYVITTGKTRDAGGWQYEATNFPFLDITAVDSWNNIKKYEDVKGAFFIFDEQRVVGNGQWSKTFIKIAKNNKWILLSATPGDTWVEYASVFIANGFYRNLTDFRQQHIVYSRFTKYPKIERYVNIDKLERLRAKLLVTMPFERLTVPHHVYITVPYNEDLLDIIDNDRWHPWENRPIRNASELCYLLREVVNSDSRRLKELDILLEEHPKAIVFYNFNYELDKLLEHLDILKYPYAQWNGHKHDALPEGDKWVYLVQYTAGAEGWNCITTDTLIFYSPNYSYKLMEQAAGRINRANTPFVDLWYYHLVTHSRIDILIGKALKNKKKFNESAYYEKKFYLT